MRHSTRRWSARALLSLIVGALALAVLFAACGDDDDAAGPAPAAEAPAGDDEVQPGVVSDPPAGSTEVRVTLSEWSVTPSVTAVGAGQIYFLVNNAGPTDPHEFVIIRSDLPIDKLPQDDTGFVPEDEVDFVGEIEEFAPGSRASGVFNLTPGRYILLCNITELEDGEWESHYGEGMRVEFIVEAPSAADTTVPVVLSEWSVSPSVTTVKAGNIEFVATNAGPVDPHELVIIRSDLPIDKLPQDDTGFVPEDEVDFVGEIEEFEPGTTASGIFALSPGRYILLCNIVELEEGEWESHYGEGMRIEFIVE